MILDYNPATKAFILRVKRGEADPRSLIGEYGLDFSTSASSQGEAVLFTKEPYCAASFASCATPQAIGQLHGILSAIADSWKNSSVRKFRCNPERELWPFQAANVEYALSRTCTLVGDQPGLGKTPTAIVYANEIQARKVLVLCPASIRYQWKRRITEWAWPWWEHGEEPKVNLILNGGPRSGTYPPDCDGRVWTVCSYDLARTEGISRSLAAGKYDLLILDEAHYLKENTSQRTRAVFGGGAKTRSAVPLAERATRIMALTGTPLLNRPREAYTLTRGLCFDAIDWMSEENFRDRFNPSFVGETEDGKRFIDERSGRHAELQNRLRGNFMIRHLKREVMPQLKMPIYDIIQLEETAAVKQALRAESLLDIDPEQLEGLDIEVLGHVSTVRKEMGIAMAPQVADYVAMLINGGEEKLVVFAWHKEVMDILEQRLARYGLIRVDGSTSASKKERLCKSFIENPGIQIALGNLLSMGVGTDGLQLVSSHALIAEPDWTPGNNIQAFDRLDRGGQTRTVQGDIFVAPNSFAERVLGAALRKNQTIHKALDRRFA